MESYEELMARCNNRCKDVYRHKDHAEDDLQKDCVGWFRDSYPELSNLLFHPNNEAFFGSGKTELQRRMAGKRAKDMGVTPGVADLILLFPSGQYHGLMIEMKTKTGKQEDSQKLWQRSVEKYGYKYVLCRERMEFRRIIEEYTCIKPKSAEDIAIERLFGNKVRVHRKISE